MNDTITVNGELYVRAAPRPTGTRAIVIIDRGWIYAGDVEDYTREDGARRIRLTKVIWPRRWSGCWLDGVIENPKRSDAEVVPVPWTVDLPADAELFRIPVADDWGL